MAATSRPIDNSYAIARVAEAIRLMREISNRDLPKDPHESPAFDIPEYMNPPQVHPIYDHYVRIWRAPAIKLTKDNFRRRVGLLEWTSLKEQDAVTTGLEWFYKAYQDPNWSDYQYKLYTWDPAPQRCRDLVDVYHSCSIEIRWKIIGLQGPDGLQLYRQQHKNKNGGPKCVNTA